jgi:hypothetical protein
VRKVCGAQHRQPAKLLDLPAAGDHLLKAVCGGKEAILIALKTRVG